MDGRWQYRLAAITGTAVLTALVITIVNNELVLAAATMLPVLGRLPADSPHAAELVFEVATATVVCVAALTPLYKPRPRRILDTIMIAQRRVVLAMIAMAAIGYFDYTYRLPRLTVLLATPLLLVVVPGWFVWIRQRPTDKASRALVAGDDPEQIAAVLAATTLPVVGYLCPTVISETIDPTSLNAVADGGHLVSRLGGLSRLDDVLIESNIDTVILAFSSADRGEFFAALDACYEHGVAAKVHRAHADAVLTAEDPLEQSPLVDIDIEPWDIQDYIIKRGFDIGFAVGGFMVLTPVIILIVVGIKLDDGGSILYRQERTAVFGETFDVYKFRTMRTGGETPEPIDDTENDRITRVGRVLRRIHLDEIPQLWSILIGDMSVVGPRAVWTEEESLLEEESEMWRKRWFVKPGLTGLAQLHNANSTNPEEKLRLDLQYIRQQSFRYDLKLVIRQLWHVLTDILTYRRN